jgi:hypothetical protein
VQSAYVIDFVLFFLADPFEDQFEKKQKDKKERVAKNEYQRLRNIARHEKGIRLQGTHPLANFVMYCKQLL